MTKFIAGAFLTFSAVCAHAGMSENCSPTGLTQELQNAVMLAIQTECPKSAALFPLTIMDAKVCFADGGADYREYTVNVKAKVDPEEFIFDYMEAVVFEGPSGTIGTVRVTGSACAR